MEKVLSSRLPQIFLIPPFCSLLSKARLAVVQRGREKEEVTHRK